MDKLNKMEMCEEELAQAAGGQTWHSNIVVGQSYGTHVNVGYLALRNYPSYDASNEIGPLWNGSSVTVTSYTGGNYATVCVNYAARGPWGNDVSGRVGYVNVNYLT